VRAGIIGVGVVVVAVMLTNVAYLVAHRHFFGPSPIPTLEGTVSPVGLPVDGVQCQTGESLKYHTHQRLIIYYHGRAISPPSAIGIPGGEGLFSTECLYWIHTHNDTPNIIHVESPNARTYTLGDFFAIWHVTQRYAIPLGDSLVRAIEAADRKHQVTVFVNGRLWRRDYRLVPLKPHSVIAVEVGRPVVKPQPFTDWSGL